MGVGQGGAISSVFDMVTLEAAGRYLQARQIKVTIVTASITVNFRKPVTPIPGVFKFESWVDRVEGSQIFVKAELSNGGGLVFDTCEVVAAMLEPVNRDKATP